jgi:RNA polymerase sigma factor (sigma-70 family)
MIVYSAVARGDPPAHDRAVVDDGGNRRGLGGVLTVRDVEGGRISTERDDTGAADADCLARVRAGDRDAYADLVRRHAPIAVRTAALLGAGADAEDVAQEAFVKAYAALDRFREGASFRPWLLRIVANEARNQHRAAGRRAAREHSAWARTEPLLTTTDGENPVSAALSHERRAELVRGLGRLSAQHREVVTCRYLLDLDEAETAAVLGWPRGTVKSRLHRALRALSETLQEVDRGA